MKRKETGKRFLGTLLSLVVAASLLSGCGSKGEMTETTETESEDWSGEASDTAESDEAVTDAATSGEAESAKEVYDEAAYDGAESNEAVAGQESGEYPEVTYDSIENNDIYMPDSTAEESIAFYEGMEENNESYDTYEENGFEVTSVNPLSTFSADVDTASYSNLRRMIEDGYTIDEISDGAVRIEELLNYFSYDFPTPKGKTPFAVTTEVSECPWNQDNYLMMVGMKTSPIEWEDAKRSNLVFLIDVSGSMEEADKLPLLQQAFSMLAENLNEDDRVSIVTYASYDEVVLEGAKGSQQDEIQTAIDSLAAGGSTNGSAGIQTAYDLAEDYFIKGGNNRVILATDGDLNVGITSEEELEELISSEKESGVYLSVLGFGTGNIKDDNMETLADKGNGNYSYIDSTYEAKKVLVEEMGATLNTVAKDVKLQVEFNPEFVNSYRLIGYEDREMEATDFNDDTKDAGELGAGHSVVALYEVVPAGSKNAIKLKYQDGEVEAAKGADQMKKDDEYATVSIRYKEPNKDTSKLLEYPVAHSRYTNSPSEDFEFASCVAEFGLIVTRNSNTGNASLDDVVSRLKDMELNDEYRQEFYFLAKQMERR